VYAEQDRESKVKIPAEVVATNERSRVADRGHNRGADDCDARGPVNILCIHRTIEQDGGRA